MIKTHRLDLVSAGVAMLEAELHGREDLARELRATVPRAWPPEHHDAQAVQFTLDRLQAHPHEEGWWAHYFIERETGIVIGAGGFKGPPRDGFVEIGYTILPDFRRHGFAVEAVLGFVTRAFRIPEVQVVVAETLPALQPSIGVLEKAGFQLEPSGSNDGIIRFRFDRAAWEARLGGDG